MENKKNKNDFPSGKDDLNIKNHLNASFDMENLTVSEELIARTLKKIQETDNGEATNTVIQKRKVKPVYRYVSAAAAVFLLVIVGTALIQEGVLNIGYNKNNSGSAESDMTIYSDEGSGTADGIEESAEAEMEINGSLASEGAPEMENEENLDAAESENAEKSHTLAAGILFSQLFPVGDYAAVKDFNFIKTGADKNESLNLTGQEAEEFYAVLDAYMLTEAGIKEDASVSYRAEIVTGDGKKIDILVQDGITVIQTIGAEETEQYYNISDFEDFMKKLDEFYRSIE